MAEIRTLRAIEGLLGDGLADGSHRISPRKRGELKQVLTSCGFPVEDLAGFEDGDPLTMRLTTELPSGEAWALRDYQIHACAFPELALKAYPPSLADKELVLEYVYAFGWRPESGRGGHLSRAARRVRRVAD